MVLVLLSGLHLLVGLLPEPPFSAATNVVLYAAHVYVLYCAWLVLRDGSGAQVGLFALGYMLLFLLVLVLLERESLFILLIIVYASVYRIPFLLGIFIIVALSYVVFQPYAFESFALLTIGYLAVWKVHRSGASRFTVFCLGGGLLVLGMVLLPIVHLVIQDSPQTLQYVFSRQDVQQAIWMSLLSSALATLIIALWGIPLAYALSRSEFRGKGVIESLIDLPILIPKSVVGVAFLVLLGSNTFLGDSLEKVGLGFAGRFAGVVLVQVFVACPFLIKTAMTAFEGIPAQLEDVSRTLGAGPSKTFFRVSLPLASRGILVGMILSWARALSEFGAMILFAPHPQTAPVLVYNEFNKAGLAESRPIAVLLLLICLWIFVLLQFGKTFLPSGFAKSSPVRGF